MNTPILHDAHVVAEFDHMLANLPAATWPAPTLPAPPKVVRVPKGSPLLLALLKRAQPRLWPVVEDDFDYCALLPEFDLDTFTDF